MRGIIIALFGAFALGSTVADHASDAVDICAAEKSDSTLAEHEECNKFYICSKGSPVAIDCPKHPTLYYNNDIKACDWPDNVDCGDRIIKEESDDDDDEEKPKVIEAPKVQEVNDDPSKAPEICAADGSDSKLVAHEECNKFYICSGGIPIANKCGNNPTLYFNPELNACDWPENVDCGSRTTDTEADEKLLEVKNDDNDIIDDDNRSYEEKAAEACALEDSDGNLLAHGDCDKFYMCSEGRPVPFQCPQTPLLFYNTLLQYCDWADSVSCGDRVLPQTIFQHKQ